jgi:hypothetical protein
LPLNSCGISFFQLDGEVRDAAAAINHVRAYNGIGGAGIYTSGAGAAMVGSGFYIVFQFDIYYQFRQEKERTSLLC